MTRSLRRIITIGLPAVLILFTSCGDERSSTDDEMFNADPESAEDAAKEKERLAKTKNIFYNIPSPMETAALLRKAGAEYDGKVLNDVQNVDKYTASSKQALNLGVYGADLSYASVFDQTSESMLYTSCARKLADKLGVTNAFTQEIMDRLQDNNKNRDSLLQIVSETYWTMDAYLKENGRANISAMVIAGGWVEGLYIATQVAKISDSEDLRTRIAEQKLSLQDLIALVNSYGEDQSLEQVQTDLGAINEIFDGIGSGDATSDVKKENGVTVIGGGGTRSTLDDEQLMQLSELVAEIRGRYIN